MTMLKKLPFFIPFSGCTRRCSYCAQDIITGQEISDLLPDIKRSILNQTEPVEICYFGGSFARLPLPLFCEFLKNVTLAPAGSRLRFSTYPTDLLDIERTAILKKYPVSCIELGIPSLNPSVLKACMRSENNKAVLQALHRLHPVFPLGVQIMTGLPQQSEHSNFKDIETLAQIKGDSIWDLRIYPCLVLRGTQLETQYREGKYSPPSLSDSVRLVGRLIYKARRYRFNVIRTGLHNVPSLLPNIIAGPWHPAFGELAATAALIEGLSDEKHARPSKEWIFSRSDISKFMGHNRFGIRLLMQTFGLSMQECLNRLRFI